MKKTTSRNSHFSFPNKDKLMSRSTLLLSFLFILTGLSTPLYANNTWTRTGDLNNARGYHTSTTLNANQVLVTGGDINAVLLGSAEIIDLNTAQWTLTASMNEKRQKHVAVLLGDGRVLVAGGSGTTSDLASAELYNPATATWSAAASMSSPRVNALVTKLQDGRVLVSSGSTGGVDLNSAEIYDPASNSWTSTGAMASDTIHTNAAVLLNDGRVFIKGHAGYTNGPFIDISPTDPFYPAESPTKLPQIYDPASNSWSTVSPMNRPKRGGTSIVLNDGKVLVVGGDVFGGASWGYPIFYCNYPAEIYDPNTDTWSLTGTLVNNSNASKASLLPDGTVLAFGSAILFDPYSGCGADNGQTEIYDPSTGTWSVTDSAVTRHDRGGSFSSLADGKVLSIGGGTLPEIVEVYTSSGPSPEPPPASSALHVSDIDGQGVENNNYPYFTWMATTTFTVADENGDVVEGAEISSISYSSQSTPDVCTTDSQGQCSLQVTESNDTRTIQVTNITKSLLTYDSAANTDPDGDSDGTNIVITRPGGPEPWMYVSDLDGSSEKKGKRRWKASVSIQITNWNGDPENYVEVFGVWSGGTSGTASCTPSSNGTCTVTSDRMRTSKGSATFTVTDAVSNWFVYDSSLNTDPDGDSNGTSITVNKP